VYSSNSGVCPGSTQPGGLFMCATLTSLVFELTRPTYSAMCFGLFPAAWMTVGASMSLAMPDTRSIRRCAHARDREDLRAVRELVARRRFVAGGTPS